MTEGVAYFKQLKKLVSRQGLEPRALALKGRTREVRLRMMESDGVRQTPDQYWRIHLFKCDGVGLR